MLVSIVGEVEMFLRLKVLGSVSGAFPLSVGVRWWG